MLALEFGRLGGPPAGQRLLPSGSGGGAEPHFTSHPPVTSDDGPAHIVRFRVPTFLFPVPLCFLCISLFNRRNRYLPRSRGCLMTGKTYVAKRRWKALAFTIVH